MALKILLADDSMTAQNMGKKILADAGYEVVAVSNGAAAVKKIAEMHPDLCILDIYMPGYTGLEVCEKIKKSSATARMPVLLTVGKMEPYKPEEGARVRADGVVVKPFEASELLRAVHRFSQRIGGATPPRSAADSGAPVPAPPASGTFEKTVKLTRQQIQEYMEPGWKGGTTTPDMTPTIAARTEYPVEVSSTPAVNMEEIVAGMQTSSTADVMPSFAVAVAETPASVAALETPAIPIEDSMTPEAAAGRESVEEPVSASPLPGFVDYILARAIARVDESVGEQPEVIHAVGDVHSTGAEILEDELPKRQSVEIPGVDPALVISPAVMIDATPDPQLEDNHAIEVANATEDGLQPTSRSAESEGVETTTDPNLAPMEGLSDAVYPLEGGRYEPPVVVEPAVTQETIEEEAEDSTSFPQPRGEVTEEIAAVLNLLEQTAAVSVRSPEQDLAAIAAGEEPSAPAPAGRVWMAEEVPLSEEEARLSLEEEMRIAYAPKAVEQEAIVDGVGTTVAVPVAAVAVAPVAPAEATVRDDRKPPQSAMPDPGGSSPGSGASPTQELAAAMAAAFGGALPQEDLARAEETQSISEEVRRFALGDAYKPKPGFGGAAFDDPEEKGVNKAKLTAAIERALDRLKPQLVAEILKELEGTNEKEK